MSGTNFIFASVQLVSTFFSTLPKLLLMNHHISTRFMELLKNISLPEWATPDHTAQDLSLPCKPKSFSYSNTEIQPALVHALLSPLTQLQQGSLQC